MKLTAPPYIDLTGHLGSLKGSLTPDSKIFEPAPPLYTLQRPHDPGRPFGLIALLFIAANLAALAYALLTS